MADSDLLNALKAQQVPLLRDVITRFSAPSVSKAVFSLKGAAWLRLTKHWFPWEGMLPSTVADADRALQRLLEAGSPPSQVVLPKKRRRRPRASPLRRIGAELASARKASPAPQVLFPQASELALRIAECEKTGEEPSYLWNFATFAEFYAEVVNLAPALLERAAAL